MGRSVGEPLHRPQHCAPDKDTVAPARFGWKLTATLVALLVGVSMSRVWWSDASWGGAFGAAVTIGAGVWLLLANLRFRAVTLGSFTAIVVLTAFWAKWMAASEPLKDYFIEVPYDNDLAVQVTGIFTLAFTLGWLAVQHLALRASWTRRRTEVTPHHAPWVPPVALLVLTALTLCALKVAMAHIYSVGVPGETPQGLDVPALKTVIYYSSTYGPLACASLIVFSRPLKPWVRWGAAGVVLVAYAASGTYVGSRGATIGAAFVPIFAAVAAPRPLGARHPLRTALAWGAGAVVAAASLSLALALRPAGSTSSGFGGILGFLEDRVGGLDFLSVAAAGVDQHGTSLSYIDTAAWIEFLTYTVYEYPPTIVTGVASTLPGFAFGVGGWAAACLLGGGTGILLGMADFKYARATEPAAATWYLGLLIAWGNLLLEGTFYPSMLIVVSFGAVYLLLASVGRLVPTRPRAAGRQGPRDRVTG